MKNKVYMLPNQPTPNRAITFNPEMCVGCNACVEICRCDVLMPNPQKKKPPIILYPDECFYCGCCVAECQHQGAITMNWPSQYRISINWKRKATGEYFRLGMKNPPPTNNKPPVGGWDAKA